MFLILYTILHLITGNPEVDHGEYFGPSSAIWWTTEERVKPSQQMLVGLLLFIIIHQTGQTPSHIILCELDKPSLCP